MAQPTKLNPNELPTYYLGIWGVERSGTNWLEVLLKRNLLDTFVTSYNKHALRSPDFLADKNQHIDEIYQDKARFVAIVKNPWAWMYSNAIKWKREVPPRFNIKRKPLRSFADRLTLYYNKNNESYIEMAKAHADRCLVISYDELILNPEETIRKIAERLNLPTREEFIEFKKEVKPALSLTKKPFNYDFYLKEEYLNCFSIDQIKWIKENVSPVIMKHCKFKYPKINSLRYFINNQPHEIYYRGETTKGADLCLLDKETDLTKGTNFEESGFIVEEFLNSKKRSQIKSKLLHAIIKRIRTLKIKANGLAEDNFAEYHNYVTSPDHNRLINSLYCNGRGLNAYSVLGQELVDDIESYMSKILKKDVWMQMPGRSEREIYCRIVRPSHLIKEMDSNPPHRDVWVPCLKDAMNIFFPIVGCNQDSILPLVAKSHRWKESDIERTKHGARIGTRRYTVPTVVNSKNGINMVRPPVSSSEILIFSPYLIHGGGLNLNENTTRTSLEIRFWLKEKE